jgi:hypothetical protein
MKKLVCFILLIALVSGVWGQEALRDETYLLSDVGKELYKELISQLQTNAIANNRYCHYSIDIYDDSSEDMVNIRIFDNGVEMHLYLHGQMVEMFVFTNADGYKYKGQDYIDIKRYSNKIEYDKLNIMVKLEHIKALAKLPEQKRKEWFFYVNEFH